MHNIPEGICVAMPIYYATGSKWKVGGWWENAGLYCGRAVLCQGRGGTLKWKVVWLGAHNITFACLLRAARSVSS